MIINITIPDDFVPKVLENLPECAADSFRCSRWDYENCTFDLTDIETNQNYTLTRAMAEDGFRKLLQEMADDKLPGISLTDMNWFELGNWDAEAMDALLQMALLGEIVYG